MSYAVLILCFHISATTFWMTVITLLVFGLAERMGYSFEVMLRRIRCKMVGKRRPAMDPLAWRRNLKL